MLAGLGLGILTQGILLDSPMTGFANAVANRVAIAFGADDFKGCRVYRNQFNLLTTILFLLLCIPVYFVRDIFEQIHQEKELAEFATLYITITTPGLFLKTHAFVHQVYAESMKQTHVRRDVQFFSALIHIFGIFITVYTMNLGFSGVCISTSITFASRYIISSILVWRFER